MKIALLHYSAPPIVGGVESVMAEHARRMADAGHEVRILAGRGSVFDEHITFIQIPRLDSRHPDVQRMKADLDRGGTPPDFSDLVKTICLELNAAAADVDVLIAHNVCSLHLNLALTAALHEFTENSRRPRLIIWHHDLAWTTPRYRDELHAGYPWDLLSRRWKWADQVVVSDQRRRELAELYRIPPEQIQVIPNGIDVNRFFKLESLTSEIIGKIKLLDASPLLLLPVRLTPRKNIELGLRVLRELLEELPEAILLVTGPLGPHNRANVEYLERLIKLRQDLGLEEQARFMAEFSDGFLPDEVIYDFYRMADALFLPSREEGFGIPILEAALEGIPIFCADIPPLRSLAGEHAGYFSPDGQPGEIADAIVGRLRSNPVYRLRSRVKKHFTWDRIYHEQIELLLGRKG